MAPRCIRLRYNALLTVLTHKWLANHADSVVVPTRSCASMRIIYICKPPHLTRPRAGPKLWSVHLPLPCFRWLNFSYLTGSTMCGVNNQMLGHKYYQTVFDKRSITRSLGPCSCTSPARSSNASSPLHDHELNLVSTR